MAKVMRLEGAAEFLGLSPRTVQRLAENGEIAISKPGRRMLLFLDDDLLAYVMRYRRAASWELIDEADRRLEELGRKRK